MYLSACLHLLVIKFITPNKLLCDYTNYTIGFSDCYHTAAEMRTIAGFFILIENHIDIQQAALREREILIM